MSHNEESSSTAPALKGATASIFLAMILHPGPQTVKSLQLATGYTFKPVRAALSLLEKQGLIRYEARIYAWVLQSGTPLLRRLRQAMSVPCEPGPEAALELNAPAPRTADRDLSTELSTAGQQLIGESPAATGESPVTPRGRAQTAAASGAAGASGRPIALQETPAAPGQNPVHLAKNPICGGEKSMQRGESPFARAPITTAANSPNQSEIESASKQAGLKPAQTSFSALDGRQGLDSRQGALAAWLVRGGIGANSAKMRELLARDLDLETVKAHVLEWQAAREGLVEGRQAYSAGLLIRKLLDGDPPPPLRCEYCLKLPGRLGLCRCDLEQVIKR